MRKKLFLMMLLFLKRFSIHQKDKLLEYFLS